MKKLFSAYLHTGTNIGNRLENMERAYFLIQKYAGNIVGASEIYETAAWGVTDQPSFLNQAIEIQTRLTPQALLANVLEIERIMGRIRLRKWGERLIDIDILFYENVVVNQPNLHIPHPRLQDRNFVLVPMMEIAPQLVHPVYNQSIATLHNQTPDVLEVKNFQYVEI